MSRINIDLQEIENRKATLERARIELKQYFVGIDEVIDDLLNYIQIWYLMPDILRRPIIVNLWGMTGVGKTDLVRRLVKLLDFQDRFAEIEINNVDETSGYSSVSSVLSSNNIDDGKPAIVLFDEIQRFNTINPDGTPIQTNKFSDFWELLSDGKLSKRSKSDLDYYIQDYLFQQKDIKRRKDRGEEGLEDNPSIGFYEAQNIKSILNLDIDVNEITNLSQREVIELFQQTKKKKKIYEPINCAKTLIIISGNLDEAFAMSTQTAEADVDADIFHSFTTKISIVDIKHALSRKFRPEQVARFGNIHLIYRSLRKMHFEQLIVKEIDRIAADIEEKCGINLVVKPTINDVIYRNGVFPVQGVRPVFSSIVDILETNLSKFLFIALLDKCDRIEIDYLNDREQIIAQIGDRSEVVPFIGRMDKIRESNEEDAIANISVHEAGHAVAYMVLFGLAPLQLKSKLANSYAGGFTFPHQVHDTRENIIDRIKIYLAGGLAEEIVFGKDWASIGRSHDREQSSVLAIDYIRKYGFDDEFQANYTLEYGYAMDKYTTDTDIEKTMARLVGETTQLLLTHKSLLLDLSLKLAAKGSLPAAEIAQIGSEYGLSVSVKEEGFLKIPAYHQQLLDRSHNNSQLK
jgi:hypothetical protein